MRRKTNLAIVGIDPGTTAAVALLDLEGNIINIQSKKEFSKSEIVNFILSNCKPIIIGTDVTKIPHMVKKIAATFGVKIWSPKEEISSDEKDRLVKNFYKFSLDSHSSDALSAAILTFKKYKELFNHVKSHLKKTGRIRYFEKVLEIVLNEDISVDAALSRIIPSKNHRIKKYTLNIPEKINWEKKAKECQNISEIQQKKIENLENYVFKLKSKISSQENKFKKLRILKKNSDILETKKTINKLVNKLKSQEKNFIKLNKNLEQCKKEINKVKDILNKIKNGWIFVDVINTEKDLESTKNPRIYLEHKIKFKKISEYVKLIICPDKKFRVENIPTCSPEDVELILYDGFAIINPNKLEKIEENTTSRFLNWLNQYKGNRNVQKNY